MATQKQAKDECRILGFSLNRTPGGDFRLAPLGKTPARAEAEASYHEIAADALATARTLAVKRTPVLTVEEATNALRESINDTRADEAPELDKPSYPGDERTADERLEASMLLAQIEGDDTIPALIRAIIAEPGPTAKPTCYAAAWATCGLYDSACDSRDFIGGFLDFCAPQAQLIGSNLERLIEKAKAKAEADWRKEFDGIQEGESEPETPPVVEWREVGRGEHAEIGNEYFRAYRHYYLLATDAAAKYDADPDRYEEPELGLVILGVESAD